MSCCSNMDTVNNSYLVSTRGSSSPFFVEARRIIFNRTSSSTSPSNTETSTVVFASTVTAVSSIATSLTTLSNVTATDAAAVAASCSQSNTVTLSSPSSRRNIAIAAGMSALLGLGLLVTLGLLWRQRKQKQNLSKAIQTWEQKFSELMKTQAVTVGGAEHQTQHQLHGWHPDELNGQPHLPTQLEGWKVWRYWWNPGSCRFLE